MMRMMDESFSGSKKVLEINTDHALIRNLARLRGDADRDALVESAVLQLFEGALLVDGSLSSPADFVSRMTSLMTEATGTSDEPEAGSKAEGTEGTPEESE